MKKEALRVSTTVPAAPTTLYLAWLSSEQHSAMTSGPAKIDSTVGGKFTALGGYISGKLVILDLGRRLVMSWRTNDFPREAPDSRVEVHLEALGGSTRVTVLHTDIPEGQAERYRSTWNDQYFGPMRTFFSKYLPDPRKPPPPRRPIPPEEEEEEELVALKKGKLDRKAVLAAKPVMNKATPSKKVAPAPSKAKAAPEPAKKSKAAPTAHAKPAPKAVPAKEKAIAKAPAKKSPPAKAPAKKAPAKKPAKGKKR